MNSLDETVHHKLGRVKPKRGEVGIEIEMEGANLPLGNNNKYWLSEHDGSLRGESLEYVLRSPCSRVSVGDRLSNLYDFLAEAGSELNPTFRTSTHIHINVQSLSFQQVFTFISLYFLFEDALVKWCGKEREGNLFCLRGRDAEYLLDTLENAARTGHYEILDSDTIRYAAINCAALFKFGSLEFRAMRGSDNKEDVEKWVRFLLKIKDASLNYKDPVDIIEGYSEGGEEWMCRDVFGKDFEELFNYEGWQDQVKTGMRLVQPFSYCVRSSRTQQKREQHLFKEPAPVPKPFDIAEEGEIQQLVDVLIQRRELDKAIAVGAEKIQPAPPPVGEIQGHDGEKMVFDPAKIRMRKEEIERDRRMFEGVGWVD